MKPPSDSASQRAQSRRKSSAVAGANGAAGKAQKAKPAVVENASLSGAMRTGVVRKPRGGQRRNGTVAAGHGTGIGIASKELSRDFGVCVCVGVGEPMFAGGPTAAAAGSGRRVRRKKSQAGLGKEHDAANGRKETQRVDERAQSHDRAGLGRDDACMYGLFTGVSCNGNRIYWRRGGEGSAHG